MKRQILIGVLSGLAGLVWTIIPGMLDNVKSRGLKNIIVMLWVVANAVFVALNIAAELL